MQARALPLCHIERVRSQAVSMTPNKTTESKRKRKDGLDLLSG